MVGEKILEYTLDPMARQVGYLIFYNSNVKELKEKAESLQHAKESVQQRLDAAYRNGDEIYSGIRMWLEKVDEMAMKVEGYIQDDHHKKTGCSSRSFPNFWMRHQLSRKSKKMVQEIEILKNEGQFEHVSYRKAPNVIQNLSSAAGDKEFGSRVEILEAIMEALRDPNMNKIGVYGMGGVGKSTLVKQVAQKAQQEFDVVVMATLTQNTEVEKIQGQIADMLGLNLSNEQSLLGRASRLLERLKKEKNVLLILDDLWGEHNWDEIGIPSPEENNNKKISISSEIQQRSCKFLMTSRDRDVLSKLNSQKYFLVRPLSDIESWKLFKEKAMLDESIGNAELLSIAHEVAQECGGLPLAVVTIASSLKTKRISEWKAVLQELRNPAPTGMQNAIYRPIEVSYQNLKDDLVQSIFLLCGMLTQNVWISGLFKYSVGLDLFKNIHKVVYARNKFDSCIRKLKDSCLLLETDSSNEFYEIHDVVRDVALMIASQHQQYFVKINQILEEWPEEEQMKNYKTIILRFCYLNDLERLCCPNLTFLLINNENPSLKLSDNLFEGMPRLKVLDLTSMKFESLPSSISLLSTLRTLCLDHCSLRKIEAIGELKGLKVLSFFKSDIKQLPQELGQLTQLQLLDLTGCSQLKLIPPNTLSSLKKLEELYMEDSFVNWDVIDPMDQQQSNSSVAELDNLPLLTTLIVHIPDERMLPEVLAFERLQKYKILIGNVWDWSSDTETSRILKLWFSTSIHFRDDIKRLLDTVEELHVGKLEGAKNVLPSLNNEGLPQLQHLYVTDNNEIQCVINSFGVIHSIDLFPNLESMVLQNVMNLEKLCGGSLTGESFSKLKIIKVKNCGNLRSLFSASIARSLPHLVEIELEECFRMERVVYDDEKAAGILQFPKLCSFTIRSLPLLLGIHYEGNVLGASDALFCEKVMFPSLEKLTIDGLDKLNMIWNRLMAEDNTHNSSICDKMKENWHGHIAYGSFCSLKTLKVANCEGISKVLSFNLLKLLNNLEELEVEGCNSVEVVFELEKITSKERHVAPMCHLRKLILISLPNLKNVWNKDPQGILEFQNLSIIKAADCQHMNYLLPVSVAKALPNLLELVLEKCTGLENIVAMEEGLDASVRFMFPKVTLLWLWDLPKLKGFYPRGYITKWPQLRKLIYLCIPKEVNCFGSKYLCFSESRFEDGPQALVQQSSSVEEVIPNLQELTLDQDDSALVTWLLKYSESYFGRIKILRLQSFQEEQINLSYSFFQRISKVETLLVGDNSFEEIFPYENQAGDGTEHENVVRVKYLYLQNLPKLRQICKEGYNVRLNDLWVCECPCLLNLVPSLVILSHLTSLSVHKCEGLLYLVAPSTAKTLNQLTVMKIEDCKMIKEIVAEEVNANAEEGDHEITFNKIKIIQLMSLPLLESFSSGNYAFKFPSLENALICECPNLKIFSKGVPTTPKLRKVDVDLEEKDWYWEGDLNETVQKMHANKEAYVSHDSLSQMDNDHLEGHPPMETKVNEIELVEGSQVFDVELLSASEGTKEEKYDLQIPQQQIPKLEVATETETAETQKQASSTISGAVHIEGVYVQSKNESTDTQTNKASLSDAGVISDQNKEISVVWQTEDSIQDHGVSSIIAQKGTILDSSCMDIIFDKDSKESTHDDQGGGVLGDDNEVVVYGQGTMSISTSTAVTHSSGEIDAATVVFYEEPTSEDAVSGYGTTSESVYVSLSIPPVSADSSIANTNCTTDITFPEGLRKFRDIIELNDEDIALVKRAVAQYPNLLKIKGSFRARFYGLAYKTLAELLHFLNTASALTITQEREQMFQMMCDEAIQFGFDRKWVEEMRKCIARDPEVDRAQKRLKELRQEIDMLEKNLLDRNKCFLSM
ncbi:hypothetical protein L6164_026392 [Bauhinia variegata]|uniref:Uncharacterized protein n=1 Tax=Bauhinia variegata TaxID=167791 RepID=A0ACB9LQ89_BAUVA|nr:hypothetical protein L6164_026392 [Bauhinia variegata]